MANIHRVQVTWQGPAVTGSALSTFYFRLGTGTHQQHVDAVETFLLATDSQRSTGLVWTIQPDSAEIDIATGQLMAIATTTGASAGGAAAGDRLPNSVQGLARLFTGAVTNGRLLRGRLFLPGPTEQSSNGMPISAYLTAYNNALAALIADPDSEWAVWSRTHAATAAIQQATVWSQWAVLRSRRD